MKDLRKLLSKLKKTQEFKNSRVFEGNGFWLYMDLDHSFELIKNSLNFVGWFCNFSPVVSSKMFFYKHFHGEFNLLSALSYVSFSQYLSSYVLIPEEVVPYLDSCMNHFVYESSELQWIFPDAFFYSFVVPKPRPIREYVEIFDTLYERTISEIYFRPIDSKGFAEICYGIPCDYDDIEKVKCKLDLSKFYVKPKFRYKGKDVVYLNVQKLTKYYGIYFDKAVVLFTLSKEDKK